MVAETKFIKMLTYVAYGLREKLQVKENNSYPRKRKQLLRQKQYKELKLHVYI